MQLTQCNSDRKGTNKRARENVLPLPGNGIQLPLEAELTKTNGNVRKVFHHDVKTYKVLLCFFAK